MIPAGNDAPKNKHKHHHTMTNLEELITQAADHIVAPAAPVEKKRGVAPGTKNAFPFNIAAVLAFRENLKNQPVADEKAAAEKERRLKTMARIFKIPQPITTEIPRTPEQVTELINAEIADATKEGRMPDLEMISGLATIKVEGKYTLDQLAEKQAEEITIRTSAIRDYFNQQAEACIMALYGLHPAVEKFAAEQAEAEDNAEVAGE